jgi:DNA-directed RNA polymerase subunit M/transcription elongation factor TFIIS
MDSKYYIKALTDNETLSLLKDKKFNTLHPVKCDKCGNTTDFRQKLYRVDTKPKKIDEDERQIFLRHHMKQNYNFDSIFFKIRNNINYIDTAFCKKCNSNMITYDIKLGDEEFEEMAKFLNVPVDEFRLEMRKIHNRLK